MWQTQFSNIIRFKNCNSIIFNVFSFEAFAKFCKLLKKESFSKEYGTNWQFTSKQHLSCECPQFPPDQVLESMGSILKGTKRHIKDWKSHFHCSFSFFPHKVHKAESNKKTDSSLDLHQQGKEMLPREMEVCLTIWNPGKVCSFISAVFQLFPDGPGSAFLETWACGRRRSPEIRGS